MPTFGNSDIIQDQSGNALANVQVQVYGGVSDAKTQTNLLASITTNSKGQWPVTLSGYDMVWVRDPAGNIWSVSSDTVAGDHAARLATLESATSSYELSSHASSTYQPASTFDATQAGNINTGGTASDVALKAKYAQRANLPLNVKAYGARGDGVTDDRAAIQSCLDAGGANSTVYLPPGIFLCSTATQAADRILKTYPGQTIIGAGRYVSVIKVGNSFGDYVTVIGCANDSTYCGTWTLSNVGIDQNAANGNALNVASKPSYPYPRVAVKLGSYTAGSSVTIMDCGFFNGDTVNTLYLYGDTLEVSGNHFLGQGGPVGTAQHDHSGIYLTTTIAGGTQRIAGNTMRGVKGSGGATTAIETHGGTQNVSDNVVSSYVAFANVTGICAINSPADGVVVSGNVVNEVSIGVHVWSQYTASLTSGTAMRNVVISGNAITIDRDAWVGLGTYLAYGWGVVVDSGNTAPIEGLSITGNTFTYLAISAAGVTSDRLSCGIGIENSNAAGSVIDLQVENNTIVNPISSGMSLQATIIRGHVKGNTVVNPAQSTEASVVAVYRSAIVIGRSLTDVTFDDNTMIDTRGTHYAQYNIYGNPTVATNCVARNNTTRYADGTAPQCNYYVAASTAGAEFFIEDKTSNGALPFFNCKVGSTFTNTATGKTVQQVTAPVGTSFKTTLALGATTGTTAPSAGAAAALPATPTGYITVNVNGTDRQVAYY